MKNNQINSTVLLTGCLLTGCVLTSQAQITANYLSTGGSSTAYDGNIVANLIQNGQSSLSSVSAPANALNPPFAVAGLNDGSAAGNGNLCYYTVFDNGLGASGVLMPDTITCQLTVGYNITSVQAISGWGDHNLGEQSFNLYLSIGGGSFTQYGG